MDYRIYDQSEFDRYVGTRLKYLHQQKSLNQRDVGDLLGISHQQYQKYEEGETKLPFYRLLTLASFYGVAIERFISPTLHEALSTSRSAFHEDAATAPIASADELEEVASLLALIENRQTRESIIGLVRSLTQKD